MSEEAAEYHAGGKEWTADQIISGLEDVDLDETEQIADKLGEILSGKHPGAQGCALAQALATWLMGYEDPQAREKLLAGHIDTVRGLLEK